MGQATLENKILLGNIWKCRKIQIYCAISAYCLVSIVADKLKLERSTYEILQVLGTSLLDKAPINELFMNINYSNVKELDYNQLSLSLF